MIIQYLEITDENKKNLILIIIISLKYKNKLVKFCENIKYENFIIISSKNYMKKTLKYSISINIYFKHNKNIKKSFKFRETKNIF